MSTSTQVGIGVGVAVLVAAIAYVALRPQATPSPLAPVAPPPAPQANAAAPQYPSWLTDGQNAVAQAADGLGAVFGNNSDGSNPLSDLLGGF